MQVRITRAKRIKLFFLMVFVDLLLIQDGVIKSVSSCLKSAIAGYQELFEHSNEHNQNASIRRTEAENDDLFRSDRRVQGVNCAGLIKHSKYEFYRALKKSFEIKDNVLEPLDFIRMTSNCSKFISDRKYILDSLTEEEEHFPIGFCILIYKDIEQFERLLRAVYRPQNYYCVHVDGNSDDDLYNAVSSIASCFNNIFLTPERIPVTWGSMSVLNANLLCMKTLYERSKLWKYFINLTGQEFPLKTNYELVKILKAYNGSNDMYGARRQFHTRWNKLKYGDPPHGMVPTKGSLLICACRGFVEFALYDYRAQDFLKWIEHTFIPDETFFASLNFNPHLKVPGSSKVFTETVQPTEHFLAHFINWGHFKCGGKIVRDVCVFGIKDVPLLSTRKELFANKFHWDFQRLGYECMEELLYNRTMDGYSETHPFDTSYYSKRRFVFNKVD